MFRQSPLVLLMPMGPECEGDSEAEKGYVDEPEVGFVGHLG